jgi:3-deoxy-7-phosphoheptulonate synthase
MLIVMHQNATKASLKKITDTITSMGFKPVVMPGAQRTAVGVLGNQGPVDDSPFRDIDGILEIIHVTKPYKLVSRDFHPGDTVITLGKGVKIGGKSPFFVIAGPCAIESHAQMLKTARFLKKLGVPALRGGAYKPRTSPHSFQGMREEGIRIMADVARETGMLSVTEVMSPRQVGPVADEIDILQIGTRNMQNYDLLREAGRANRPVILKRGLSATMEEWLASAEYIMNEGNRNIILCERGIRTFETATRNTADLAIIPLVRSVSHLPVIFDPSHATGIRALVAPLALASVAAGAQGLMVEVHPDPEHAASDGKQSLHFNEFRTLNKKLNTLLQFAKKERLF